MDVDKLRAAIEANIKTNSGNLVLPDPLVVVDNLQVLLQKLISANNLTISGASLSTSALGVSGKLSLFDVEFDVTVSFGTSPVSLTISADLAEGQHPHLGAVVTHFFPRVDPLDIDLSTLAIRAATADKTFSVAVGLTGGTHGIPLGASNTVISTVSGSLDYDAANAEVSADIQLTAKIASVDVNLDYKPPATVELTGMIPRIDLGAAMNAFLSTAFPFPSGFPSLSLRRSTITISKQGQVYGARLTTTIDNWGALELDIGKHESWGVAAGIALLESFSLDSISPEFAALPLDGAKLEPSALVISSYTGANPFSNPQLQTFELGEGIAFHAGLDVSGSSGALALAMGFFSGAKLALDIDGALTNPLANSYIEAGLHATAIIPNTKIGIGDPALRLTLAPAVQVRGVVHIPIKGQYVDLTGGMTVSTTQASLFVDADFSQLPSPVGFQGVTLENIGGSLDVTFEPPGVGLTLQGDFLIGNSKADTQFAFSFSYTPPALINPRLLQAVFEQLDITTMASALVPQAPIPHQLDDINFRNFTIYWADSQVQLPDGTTAQPGFGFNGLVDLFGWTAYAELKIDANKGFVGAAALSPIDIANGAFTFTGDGKGHLGVRDGGATLDVDTSSASFAFSAAANLLGITGSASGSVSPSGVQFAVASNRVGGYDYLSSAVSGTFTSDLNNPNIAFGADIAFSFDFTTDRIKFPGTDYFVGKLHVSAHATGSLHTALRGATFTLDASVGFNYQAKDWSFTLPTIRKQPADLANFGATVAAAIEAQAADFFSELWSSAAAYVNLIAQGVISEIDPNPLGVVMNVYHMSEGDALKLLAKVKGLIPHVDQSFPPHGDTRGPHVDQHGDTRGPHADTRGPHVDQHGDVFGVGHHVDQGGPHLDQGGPHIDTPHADTAPHIDTPSTHWDI